MYHWKLTCAYVSLPLFTKCPCLTTKKLWIHKSLYIMEWKRSFHGLSHEALHDKTYPTSATLGAPNTATFQFLKLFGLPFWCLNYKWTREYNFYRENPLCILSFCTRKLHGWKPRIWITADRTWWWNSRNAPKTWNHFIGGFCSDSKMPALQQWNGVIFSCTFSFLQPACKLLHTSKYLSYNPFTL